MRIEVVEELEGRSFKLSEECRKILLGTKFLLEVIGDCFKREEKLIKIEAVDWETEI